MKVQHKCAMEAVMGAGQMTTAKENTAPRRAPHLTARTAATPYPMEPYPGLFYWD